MMNIGDPVRIHEIEPIEEPAQLPVPPEPVAVPEREPVPA